MFIEIGHTLINCNSINAITFEQQSVRERKPMLEIVINKSQRFVVSDFDANEIRCSLRGTGNCVVPAAPGYSVLWTRFNCSDLEIGRFPIVGWTVDPACNSYASPVTLELRENYSTDSHFNEGILCPDGRVYCGDHWYSTRYEFERSCRDTMLPSPSAVEPAVD